jgi:DNA-binding response OmpR family regulator
MFYGRKRYRSHPRNGQAPYRFNPFRLDVMPKETGFEVCKQLRGAGNKTPIIF